LSLAHHLKPRQMGSAWRLPSDHGGAHSNQVRASNPTSATRLARFSVVEGCAFLFGLLKSSAYRAFRLAGA
ncbi:hypothetical protein, partial [Mesorhizobium sp.]|uniref:hypothetical protein n=1 Tax=Mesorhizobium sp. TaxID=1871066 RepID=UPI0025C2F827